MEEERLTTRNPTPFGEGIDDTASDSVAEAYQAEAADDERWAETLR